MVYQVSASRSVHGKDYEIEALLEADSELRAAQQFFVDWLGNDWEPSHVVVSKPGAVRATVYRVERNIIRRED